MDLAISANNVVGFILLVTVIVMEVNISLQQHCLTPISSQSGYALVGKEYKSFTTEDYPACMMECKKDERCMSLNFHFVTKTCDLNTQTKESMPPLYKVRPNSIYSTNMAFRTPEPIIGKKDNPAKSCLEILNRDHSVGTGVYWIDPANTGNPIKAYCDMTTDGGGWTIVKKTIFQTATPPRWESKTDLNVIAAYDRNDMWIIPKVAAMVDIHQKMGFHQIHFYCHKKSVGRVVSIRTKNNTAGQAVVKYFTNLATTTVFPTSCGSFDKLPEDTSFLSKNCDKWGPLSAFNRWSSPIFNGLMRLGTVPFQIYLPSQYFYGAGYTSSVFRYCCDDDYVTPSPLNAEDTWQISVR